MRPDGKRRLVTGVAADFGEGIASDEAQFLTGSILEIDGGRTI